MDIVHCPIPPPFETNHLRNLFVLVVKNSRFDKKEDPHPGISIEIFFLIINPLALTEFCKFKSKYSETCCYNIQLCLLF